MGTPGSGDHRAGPCSAPPRCRSSSPRAAGHYFASLAQLQQENAALRSRSLATANQLLRQQHLELENQRLRALLDMKERQPAEGRVAEILYAARDPFSRRVVVDKGSQHDIAAGQAVVDDARRHRPGDARLPAEGRGHAAHRQGPGDPRADAAQRPARRRLSAPAPASSNCASSPPMPTSRSATVWSLPASTASICPACRWPRYRGSIATPPIRLRPHRLRTDRRRRAPRPGAGARLARGAQPQPEEREASRQDKPAQGAGRSGKPHHDQPTHHSHRILLPVPQLVHPVLAAAGALPQPRPARPTAVVPDWVALVLIFWCVHQPLQVGMGTAFVARPADGCRRRQRHGPASAGLSCCSPSPAAACRGASSGSRCCQQALHILPLLLAHPARDARRAPDRRRGVSRLALICSAASSPPCSGFRSPIVLLLPQYRPVEKDDNRPI